MTEKIEHLVLRWAQTLGIMAKTLALVRSQCHRCGIQLRVDIEAMISHRGPSAGLINISDRCSIVACSGTVFYLAAKFYGRPWIPLIDREDLIDNLGFAAPVQNAQTLGVRQKSDIEVIRQRIASQEPGSLGDVPPPIC